MVDEIHDSMLDESFAFQTSSPQSLRQASSPRYVLNHPDPDLHNYNNPTSNYDEDSDIVPVTTDDDDYNPPFDDHAQSRAASTRMSSVSSFPASIIHTLPTYHDDPPFSASRSFLNTARSTTPANASSRMQSTGFRNPSSVRALQMRDEFDLSDYGDITPQRRHKSRSPYLSRHSSGAGSNSSSPSKRNRSNNTSPLKSNTKSSNLRKEFPLVLLHCTILSPELSLRMPAKLGDSVLEAIIPQPYGKRWKILQEKVVRNTELKTRGVLIPHPRDEFEFLEEKLLETLELEKPRLREGHFLDKDDRNTALDSGFESGSVSSSEIEIENDDDEQEGIQKTACPDCGKCLSEGVEEQRKWNVKVYAANGLMRAGAWSAAWSEMEKVDVEISVWMPEDVRREVDVRIEALIEQERIEKEERRRSRKKQDHDRMREIYGSDAPEPKVATVPTERSQAEIDGLFEARDFAQTPSKVEIQHNQQEKKRDSWDSTKSSDMQEPLIPPYAKTELPLSDLLINYIRLLARDQRNIAIVLLGMLVLFYALANPHSGPSKDINNIWKESDNTIYTGMSMSEIEIKTVTTTALETSTVVETVILSSTTTTYEETLATSTIEQILPFETDVPAMIVTDDTSSIFEGITDDGTQTDNESNIILSQVDQRDSVIGDEWDIPVVTELIASLVDEDTMVDLYDEGVSLLASKASPDHVDVNGQGELDDDADTLTR